MKLWYGLLALIVAIFATAYYFVPVIRYYLIPLTRGTQAPKSLLTKKASSVSSQTSNQAGSILANETGSVPSIDQVSEQGGWINSLPLHFPDIYEQKRCILIDFWTYSCINCIRATPYTQELWDRYKDYGLVVIGVHSPEFGFEKKPSNILEAIKKAHITYPVWTDADKRIWNEFGNHFWPGKYLIDPSNTIIYTQFGEGGYNEEDKAVRRALIKAGWSPPAYGPTAKFLEPSNAQVTPELYAGIKFLRKPFGNQEQPKLDSVITFNLPGKIQQDAIYLQGAWFGAHDYVESRSHGSIVLNYLANAPYIVLSSNEKNEPHEIDVLLDGKPVPAGFQGKDIVVKNGKTRMVIDMPRLYYPLADKAPYGRHVITFHVDSGVRLYSFTFGVY